MQSEKRASSRAGLFPILALLVLGLVLATSSVGAGSQTVGVFINEPGSFDGYTLFHARDDDAYLIDSEGRLVHSWADVGASPYLLENGDIMTGPVGARPTQFVRRFAWDGTLLWEYSYTVADGSLHHDLAVLPNGNVVIVTREIQTEAEAIAAGRDPTLLQGGELRALYIIEIEPTGPTSGDIVWEWHSWDHLVQDVDPTKDNFGVVADSPELVDVNFIEFSRSPEGEADWHHTNALDYNEDLDQIVVTVRHFSEIWVIDHSTTSAEAASDSGGISGKGGDLLYRWGNPQAYGAGDAADQQLFSPHDGQWIATGMPGAGNILIFNNGNGRPDPFSSVVEITTPVDGFGDYPLTPGEAFGPVSPAWEYDGSFYASFLSGSSRLPNGNTLINDGPAGTLIEVTPVGETVWLYVNPVINIGPIIQGELLPSGTPNRVFRAYRYSPSYSAFDGRDLTPGEVLEADTDLDGLSDLAEAGFHGTDPLLTDTDGDGCGDGAELGVLETQGGRRDPLNPYDFYDVLGPGAAFPLDGVIDLPNDVMGVIQHFAPITTMPTYDVRFDRGVRNGPNPWNMTAPDGVIDLPNDILSVILQRGHDCG